jgi:hypothetical protein
LCLCPFSFARKMERQKSESANLNGHSTWNSMPFKFPCKELKCGFVHESPPVRLCHWKWWCESVHAQKLESK